MRTQILISSLAASSRLPVLPVEHLARALETGGWFMFGGLVVGAAAVFVLRLAGLSWTWGCRACCWRPCGGRLRWQPSVGYMIGAFTLVGFGAWKHFRDLRVGGEVAVRARARLGPSVLLRAWYSRRKLGTGRWVTDEGMVVGSAAGGELVWIPLCGVLTVHVLTGSGKTVLFVLVARVGIERGMGVVFIDPKGDDFARAQLQHAARRAGRGFYEWAPDGGCVYNPYEQGSDSEIVDKLLAGDVWTEPHYLRLAQRYLGHAVRAMRGTEVPVTLRTIVEHMYPGRLASLARRLPRARAEDLLGYLDSLTAQQQLGLAGARDRLAYVAESDAGRWLDPKTPGEAIDLRGALERGDVVLFRLDADRLPLLAPMLAAAVVQDLGAISSARQHGQHRPALLVIDEAPAVAPRHIGGLFARGRGAGLSMLIGAQELSYARCLSGGAPHRAPRRSGGRLAARDPGC